MDTFKLAWRNVWRNPRRSGVTIGATALALFCVIFYAGLMNGNITGMERSVVELELGDAQIFAEGYRKKPSLYTVIDDLDALLGRLDAAGFRGSARLLGSGLAAAGDNSAGVQLRGLDVARDAAVSSVSTKLDRGAWLDPASPGEVVLGRRLARTLGVDVGGEIVVLSQAADGSTANDVYKVRGVLLGVSDPVDRAAVFMTTDAFRELMALPAGAHQILVRTPEGEPLDQATAALAGLAPGLETRNWKALNPGIASMLETSRAAMSIMFVIVYIAIGIVVLNAALMSVFERIREFGVLKALGVGPGEVLRLILLETLIQTFVAIVVGVAVSVPVNLYMTRVGLDLSAVGTFSLSGVVHDPIWRSEVDVDSYVRPIVILVVIILLAVLYPAIRAALVRPLDAIRHQ